MTNRVSGWLLIVIVMVMVPFWWLLIDTDRGSAPPKPVGIAELRTLAEILPGQRPTGVSYTLLAARRSVGDFYAAGIGVKRRSLAVVAWSLPVPGKGPIMIDPGAPAAEAGLAGFTNFDRAKQSRVDAQARVASLILYTLGHESDLPRAIYYLGKGGISMVRPPRPSPQPVSYTTAQAVAPGVVVIPASSHAPGARLIYVQLADGREYLFAGNIAPYTENWSRLRARSHLAAIWGPAQDRAETYAWLRTIRQLRIEAPKLAIVPGHDLVWLNVERGSGAITETRVNPAPPPKIAKAR